MFVDRRERSSRLETVSTRPEGRQRGVGPPGAGHPPVPMFSDESHLTARTGWCPVSLCPIVDRAGHGFEQGEMPRSQAWNLRPSHSAPDDPRYRRTGSTRTGSHRQQKSQQSFHFPHSVRAPHFQASASGRDVSARPYHVTGVHDQVLVPLLREKHLPV